jgi:hypothetical protein
LPLQLGAGRGGWGPEAAARWPDSGSGGGGQLPPEAAQLKVTAMAAYAAATAGLKLHSHGHGPEWDGLVWGPVARLLCAAAELLRYTGLDPIPGPEWMLVVALLQGMGKRRWTVSRLGCRSGWELTAGRAPQAGPVHFARPRAGRPLPWFTTHA